MIRKELLAFLDTFNNITVPNLIAKGFKANPINAREGLANITKNLLTNIPAVDTIYDDYIYNDDYNIPVRIYVPKPNEKLNVLIYYHGGGHMSGSVSVYDPICRKLALATNHIVVAIEYRLAPENPYPYGLIDAYNAVKHVWATLESRKLQYHKSLRLGGDSGGAAIVGSVVMQSQFDESVKIDKMFMIYPSLDYTMELDSLKTNGKGYLLESTKIKWYFDSYFSKGEDRVKASPLYNPITAKIPSAIIFTVEYCPLKDEGLAYIAKLKEAGVKVEHHHIDTAIHTFMNMEDLCKEECEFVYKKINNFLAN